MAKHKFKFGEGVAGAALPVKVTPRARANQIVGFAEDGTLKVRVTAPPVGGAANEAVIALLAEALGVAKGKIEIVAGHTSTQKLVSVVGLSPEQVDQRLQAAMHDV